MRPSRLLSFIPSLHRAPSRLPKPITRSAHHAHNGLTQTIGKRFLHSSSTFLPTFNWAPIAVAAIIGGGISALNWDDASAAESPLTVESWKKSLETVLNKNPEDMELEHFLAAVEVTMATVNKIPPEELKESFEHVHRVFVRLTTLLLEMEIYEGALRFQEQFIKLCEAHDIGSQYPAIYSYALNDIGETYWEMKDTKKAAKFYSHNIRFNENLKRHSNNSSIGTLLDLQLAYGKLALCQATEMKKSTSDKDVPTSIRKLVTLQQSMITQISSKDGCKPSKKIIATISAVNTLLELANIFLEKGRTQDCLTYFQEASEICSKFSAFDKEFKGKQDGKATSPSSRSSSSSNSSSIPSLADTRDNIELSRSACITRLGRHQEAEQIVRDLLNQQLKRVGTNSPMLIPTYNNLGYILSAQRHFAESETYLRKGIALANQQKQNTLEYAQKTFEMQHLLSGVLLAQHKHDQAIDILQKNLILGSRIFGSSSTLMVETYAQLGFSFRSAGDLTKSLDYLNKAYTFGLDILSLSSPLAYKIGTEYAFALAESGNFKEAEKIFTSTKTGVLNSYGSQSIQHVMATVKMASLYERMGEYNKSEVEYNTALKIARKLNPSPQRELTIANCEVSLGKIFTGMRRYKEAKSCLDSAIAKLKEADNPLPLALAYSALSNWYLLSGQLNQAVVSLENAWETLKESSAPLDSPEAIDMQLEMAELHTRHRTPEISIQALKSLSSTVQSSETLSYAQKRNIKERIDEKLRAAEEAVASK